MSGADFAALLPDVARRLLGEPPSIEAGGDTWRYRARGSLAVHVGGAARGTWRDFEADRSGGTVALVEHLAQTDRPGALRWLEAQRLIARRSNGGGALPAPRPAPARPARAPRPAATADVAAAILAAAVPADATPARAYLARRWTWPPLGTGPGLPSAVRWLPVAAVPALPTWAGTDGKARRVALPADAAGAVVYVFALLPDGAPVGVSVEAVTPGGEHPAPRWRRTFGTRTDAVFEAARRPGGAVVLAEGERDALALAAAGYGGAVRAVGGTAGYREAAATDGEQRPVVVVPDADHAGARAVVRLLAGLPGRTVRLAPWPAPATGDPAAWLAELVSERAGIREYDGGAAREAATADAWHDLMAAAERGADPLNLEAT